MAALRAIKTLLVAAIAIFGVLFCIDNRATITVSLFPFPYSADMPQFLLVILCVAAGIFCDSTVTRLHSMKNNRQAKSEKKRAAALQNEVESLRAGQRDTLPVVPK